MRREIKRSTPAAESGTLATCMMVIARRTRASLIRRRRAMHFALRSAPLTLLLLIASCDRQRDLWVRSRALLEVEGDWVPSLQKDDMSGHATAMFYPTAGAPRIEFFARPRTVDTPVEKGAWGVLIFNGTMFSERQTNLEQIYFHNTAAAATFEAVVADGTAQSKTLSRAEGERIASNGMELLTAAYAEACLEDDRTYYVKYINGIDQHPVVSSYVEQTLTLTPVRLNWWAQVVVKLGNAGSATTTCSAAVRGFAGSAMMATATPGIDRVTHQVALTKLMIDPTTERGTVESEPFVTFGPPLNAPAGWKYEVEVNITTRDGEVTSRTFDVADQLAPVIEKLKSRTLVNEPDSPILLVVELDLPEIEAGVNLDPWDDGGSIVVPIH